MPCFMPAASSKSKSLLSVERAGVAGHSTTPVLSLAARAQGGLLDLHQELDVVARLLDLVQEQFHGLLRLQRVQHAAELDEDRQLVGREQDLLLAGARR